MPSLNRAAAIVVVGVLGGVLGGVSSSPNAQHSSHDQWHGYYINWVNSEGKGCCNNRDCHEIGDADERTTDGELQVLVRGVGRASGTSAWCPIQRRHYLSNGNAPNWGSSHVCVTDFYGGATPCEQLICYQPRPAF